MALVTNSFLPEKKIPYFFSIPGFNTRLRTQTTLGINQVFSETSGETLMMARAVAE